MKFSTVLTLVLAITFTSISVTFFIKASTFSNLAAMPLCGDGIAWLIPAGISWAVLTWRWKTTS